MSKRYIANIELYGDDMKYSIVGHTELKRVELIELVKDFIKERKGYINQKTQMLFDEEGHETGTYEIISQEF